MERETTDVRVFEVEIRAADEKQGEIVGRVAPFGEWSAQHNYLESFDEHTFARSVAGGGGNIPLLLHHDHDSMPIGRPVSWETQDDGLYGVFKVDRDSERGAEAWRLMDDSFIRGLSVGFTPDVKADKKILDDPDGVPRLVRRNAKLREVSLVSVPAYDAAQVLLTRSSPLHRAPDPRIKAYADWFGVS